MSDLPFDAPDSPRNLGAPEPRKCRRHEWIQNWYWNGGIASAPIWQCVCCNRIKDEAASRRGRTSRRAGHDAERTIAKALGGKRTGQFGGPDDVTVGELFVIQSKAGGWFTERVWSELLKLPRTGGRVPLLIVSDRPGSGRRTRRYVVVDFDDWRALHGDAA